MRSDSPEEYEYHVIQDKRTIFRVHGPRTKESIVFKKCMVWKLVDFLQFSKPVRPRPKAFRSRCHLANRDMLSTHALARDAMFTEFPCLFMSSGFWISGMFESPSMVIGIAMAREKHLQNMRLSLIVCLGLAMNQCRRCSTCPKAQKSSSWGCLEFNQ